MSGLTRLPSEKTISSDGGVTLGRQVMSGKSSHHVQSATDHCDASTSVHVSALGLNTHFSPNDESTIHYINSTKTKKSSMNFTGETNLKAPKQFTKSVKAANGKKSLFQEI